MKSMMILGIDPGTNCGWALLKDGQRIASGRWDLSSRRHEGGGMRYLRARRNLLEICESYKVDAVAYEEVRRHRSTDAAHVYGGIVAVITATCEEYEMPFKAIPVGTVKKVATGKGNAGKEMMRDAAEARWGIELTGGDDEADALFIALALYEDMKI